MSRAALVRLFWVIFALSTINFLIMLIWTLPALQGMADGLAPFDLRPSGYTVDEARALIAALGEQGATFYTNIQHKFDTTYPALLGLTLGLAIYLLAPQNWGVWRWLLAAVAIPGPVFDYFENAAVASMLNAGATGTTAQMVETASSYTTGKATGSSVAMTLVLLLALIWIVRRLIAKRQSPKVPQP